MKLSHPLLLEPILINADNIVTNIIIENQNLFYSFSRELLEQTLTGEGNFCLSINAKEINMQKETRFIDSFFNLELERSDINSLIKYFNQKAQEENVEEIRNIHIVMVDAINKLLINENQAIYYSEYTFSDILKMLKLNINIDTDCLNESIIDYLSILAEYCQVKIFFLVNLSIYLGNIERESLVKELKVKNLRVVFIDNLNWNDSGKKIIIDNDICVLK